MEKSFLELLKNVEVIKTQGSDVMASSLEYDSRKIKSGAVFFALSGLHTHGEKYILSAIKNGARAIVHENDLTNFEPNVFYAKVKNARFAMAQISANFYEHPSKTLKVIGVTGTEGKSSTVSFIWQLLNTLGFKAGYFSTVSYSYGDINEEQQNPEHQTTPESTVVQKRLYEMKKNGCEYAIVESSSHGLSELTARLENLEFDVGVFINVTEEHLEFHKTFERYRFDKANLFRKLDKSEHIKNGQKIKSFGVVNLEDPSADYFFDATEKDVYGFSTELELTKTDFAKKLNFFLLASNIKEKKSSINFTITSFETDDRNPSGEKIKKDFNASIPLAGVFNVQNILASLLTVHKITGTSLAKIIDAFAKLKPITGRMFNVDEGQNFNVLIDYAHTPSSFETIMPPIAENCHRQGKKLIAVFGSGGERDRTKRPEQGRIASKYCDIIILTDEDPRGEDRIELLTMIAEGVENKKIDKTLFIIPDRPLAIRKAFSLCTEGDTVLLLGKGHENSIIFHDYVMPYDEETEARKALKELK
ncbi:MAG: UDP-N-acetylmuramoyl-L-alanyl-D-glutamate--2,6-diaminopimelate ligase [Treponemataceae bacterium]